MNSTQNSCQDFVLKPCSCYVDTWRTSSSIWKCQLHQKSYCIRGLPKVHFSLEMSVPCAQGFLHQYFNTALGRYQGIKISIFFLPLGPFLILIRKVLQKIVELWKEKTARRTEAVRNKEYKQKRRDDVH